MSILRIKGGRALSGSIRAHGSKNAILPMMAASILYPGITVLHGVPEILDVFYMIEILEQLGCKVKWQDSSLVIDASAIESVSLSSCMTGKMRSSVFLLGPLLARCGEAKLGQPGGCSIGSRPVDIHVAGLQQMGAELTEENGWLRASASCLHGNVIRLPFPSVGATENLIMAAVLAEGETILHHAAREPEIGDLCRMLQGMGARIKGIGSSTLEITGVDRLRESAYTVKGDRIEASTYLIAAAASGGELMVENVLPGQLTGVLTALSICGCDVMHNQRAVYLRRKDRLRPVPYLRTAPFPGFPTDVQSQMMALLSCADGESIIHETIFEGRFQTALELRKMGADICMEGNKAVIQGVQRLTGTKVCARDLRGGAALVIAGLTAEGITEICHCTYIQRGYAALAQHLVDLGADIEMVEIH